MNNIKNLREQYELWYFVIGSLCGRMVHAYIYLLRPIPLGVLAGRSILLPYRDSSRFLHLVQIMATYQTLELEVIRWAENRKIIPNSTPLAQAIKTTEEVAELLKALSKNDLEEAKDAYADILITLIIGSSLLDVNLVSCLEQAYLVIKNRKGYLTSDGIFVKQE